VTFESHFGNLLSVDGIVCARSWRAIDVRSLSDSWVSCMCENRNNGIHSKY